MRRPQTGQTAGTFKKRPGGSSVAIGHGPEDPGSGFVALGHEPEDSVGSFLAIGHGPEDPLGRPMANGHEPGDAGGSFVAIGHEPEDRTSSVRQCVVPSPTRRVLKPKASRRTPIRRVSRSESRETCQRPVRGCRSHSDPRVTPGTVPRPRPLRRSGRSGDPRGADGLARRIRRRFQLVDHFNGP